MAISTEAKHRLGWVGAGATVLGLSALVLPRILESNHSDSEGAVPSSEQIEEPQRMKESPTESSPPDLRGSSLSTRVDQVGVEPKITEPTVSSQGDRFSDALTVLKPSFLSDQPNIVGLSQLALQLAQVAAVEETSVTTDAFGSVKGALTFEGTNIGGTFSISPDGRYQIAVTELSNPEPDSPFLRNQVSLGFNGNGGTMSNIGLGVQYSPDTRRPPSDFLSEGEERIIGWHCSIQDDLSTIEQPLSMQASENGHGWRIGYSESLKSRQSWSADSNAHSVFFSLLDDYQP